MQKSVDSSTPVITQLKRWVKANVLTPHGEVELKKPSEFARLTESARRRVQYDDRDRIADQVMNTYGSNPGLVAILAGLGGDPGTPDSRAKHSSAVREALKLVQEDAWNKYAHSMGPLHREPVTV